MTDPGPNGEAIVLEPKATEMRKRFRASARALMTNRPLREVAADAPRAVLSRAELEALERVGLSTKPWTGDAAADPLASTIIDYMALVETSLGTAEVAQMLNVDVSRVRQRIRQKSLVAFDYEGQWHLPRFQFERGKVVPGLAPVLAVMATGLNPLDVAAWFLDTNLDLQEDDDPMPISPREWLLRGRSPEVVMDLARHL